MATSLLGFTVVFLGGFFAGVLINKFPDFWYRAKNIKYERKVVGSESLAKHAADFRKPQVIKVKEGIHVAVGYALGNSILLEAPDGLIVVDTTENYGKAKEIYQQFRNISQKPIKHVVYTHNHADHCLGTKAFVENEPATPQVWAHQKFPKEVERSFGITNAVHHMRAMRQFGVFIDAVSGGLGPSLQFGRTKEVAPLVRPTRFITGAKEKHNLAGLDIEFFHIPGETDDQIGLWLKNERTFLAADDIYKAFPNLYAIRGTPNRDLKQWYESLDIIRDLRPSYLVPSHHRPIEGENVVSDILTNYRDAIQFVHDQTVRWMNKGLTADEIVQKVKLPDKLANHPYLQEFYGTVAWSVRGCFTGYLGWFSGDPVDLSPLPRLYRAEKFLDAIGGLKQALELASQSEKGDPQWTLEIVTNVLLVYSEEEKARALKIRALESLANEQTSANGRNYYLSCAEEERGTVVNKPTAEGRKMATESLPMKQLLQLITLRLDPSRAAGKQSTVAFNFTDTGQTFNIHLRNSIAHLREEEIGKYDAKLTMDSKVWRGIVGGQLSARGAYMSGDLELDGGLMKLMDFFALFETVEFE